MPTFYAASTGSDSNPGSSVSPKGTITGLLNAMKASGPSATEDVVGILMDDVADWGWSASQQINATHNIPGGYRYILKAAPGTKPRITDRVKLTGWTQWSANSTVFWKSVGLNQNIRHVWYGNDVNGEITPPRRGHASPAYLITMWDTVNKTIRVAKSGGFPLTAASDLSGMEMVIPTGWNPRRLRIASITDGGTYWNITPMSPEREVAFAVGNAAYIGSPPPNTKNLPFAIGPYQSANQYFWLEYGEALQQWNTEWTFLYDRNDFGLLYVRPPEGTTASDLNTIGVYIPGTAPKPFLYIGNNLGGTVEKVILEGITFCCMSWGDPTTQGYVGYSTGLYSNGFVDGDNDLVHSYGSVPTAIQIQRANNIAIRCRFEKLGIVGIKSGAGVDNLHIDHSAFVNMASAAHIVNGFTSPYDISPPEDQSNNVYVHDNVYRNIGRDYGGYALALVGTDVQLFNNDAKGMYHGFCQVGTGARLDPNWMIRAKVHHNKVRNCMLVTVDGAAVYFNGNWCGRAIWKMPRLVDQLIGNSIIIYLNDIEGFENHGWNAGGGEAVAFYGDLGTQGAHVFYNRASDGGVGIQVNAGRFNSIHDNFLDNLDINLRAAFAAANRVTWDEVGATSVVLYRPPTSATDFTNWDGNGSTIPPFKEMFPFTNINAVADYGPPVEYNFLGAPTNNDDTVVIPGLSTGVDEWAQALYADLLEM